jgi:hypothetical protein
MTTTTDEAGLQLTTILIATTIPASLLKTLSQNFPEDLEPFLLFLIFFFYYTTIAESLRLD